MDLRVIAAAVELAVGLTGTREERQRAYQICEDFRSSSSSAQLWHAGMALINASTLSLPVRYYGYQSMRHVVTDQWNSLTSEMKQDFQRSALRCLSDGLGPTCSEHVLKSGLVSLVVDLMKVSWPQHWPNCLSGLLEISQMGEEQLELVILVLIHLAEDVTSDVHLSQKRKAELIQSLQVEKCLLKFLECTLQSLTAASRTELIRLCLLCLARVFELASLEAVFENDGSLIDLICALLLTDEVKIPALDSLSVLANRKGKLEERSLILYLFRDKPILHLIELISLSDEANYEGLKRACNVLSTVGVSQLCSLWGSERFPRMKRPPNFDKYLQCLMTFLKHPSQTLGMTSMQTWLAFLKNDAILRDQTFLTHLPAVLELSGLRQSKCIGVLYDSSMATSLFQKSVVFAQCDFADIDEYYVHFGRLRSVAKTIITIVTALIPDVALRIVTKELARLLEPSETCHYVEWDALAFVLELVMSRVDLQISADLGGQAIDALVGTDAKDDELIRCNLNCLYALFPCLECRPDRITPIFSKIFSFFQGIVQRNKDDPTLSFDRSLASLRRLSCSMFLSLCKDYGTLAVRLFDQVRDHVKRLINENLLLYLERVIFVEGLISLSQSLDDTAKKVEFIQSLIAPVNALFLDATDCRILKDSKIFFHNMLSLDGGGSTGMKTVGLEWAKQFVFCLKTLLAIERRCLIPCSPTALRGKEEISKLIFPHIKVLLTVFELITSFWKPDVFVSIEPEFQGVFSLTASENKSLLGVPTRRGEDTDSDALLDRAHVLLVNTMDVCVSFTGTLGEAFGSLYGFDDFARTLLLTALANVSYVPNYYLRSVIRSTIRPLCLHCPPEHFSSFIDVFCPAVFEFLFKRLSSDWNKIAETLIAAENEREEVLERRILSNLTREMIAFLQVCLNKRVRLEDGNSPAEAEDEADVDMTELPDENPLSDLGQHLMDSEVTCQHAASLLFSCLTWLDTVAAVKAAKLLLVSCDTMLNAVSSGNVVQQLYIAVLQGLERHGQHEGAAQTLMALALKLYKLWRTTRNPGLVDILLSLPDSNISLFQELNGLCENPQQTERTRKEQMRLVRSIFQPIIGKPLAQAFCKKREMNFNLPKLSFRRKQPDFQPDGEDGLSLLFGK
ncbi:exportin-5-like isoform X2 [Oscarella lobularis]|uniref:exportin-5-like isoform X2 n=1 Tax=Oscarella lobularis TaxID=121494 RepID=UPI003313F40B